MLCLSKVKEEKDQLVSILCEDFLNKASDLTVKGIGIIMFVFWGFFLNPFFSCLTGFRLGSILLNAFLLLSLASLLME